jgi:hypothetical protein
MKRNLQSLIVLITIQFLLSEYKRYGLEPEINKLLFLTWNENDLTLNYNAVADVPMVLRNNKVVKCGVHKSEQTLTYTIPYQQPKDEPESKAGVHVKTAENKPKLVSEPVPVQEAVAVQEPVPAHCIPPANKRTPAYQPLYQVEFNERPDRLILSFRGEKAGEAGVEIVLALTGERFEPRKALSDISILARGLFNNSVKVNFLIMPQCSERDP